MRASLVFLSGRLDTLDKYFFNLFIRRNEIFHLWLSIKWRNIRRLINSSSVFVTEWFACATERITWQLGRAYLKRSGILRSSRTLWRPSRNVDTKVGKLYWSEDGALLSYESHIPSTKRDFSLYRRVYLLWCFGY